MISSELNLNHKTVQSILTEELVIQKICAKLVQKILTNEQKENRRNLHLDLLESIENDKNFFKRVITDDESWIRLKGRHFGTGQHPKGRDRASEGTST
jgi:hypothetical protein